jgi:hypothetical protein
VRITKLLSERQEIAQKAFAAMGKIKYSPAQARDGLGRFALMMMFTPDKGGGGGAGKESTPETKPDSVKPENEHDVSSKPGAIEDSAGRSPSAEKLTRDELGRVARADAADGHPEYHSEGRYHREAQALVRLRDREPSLAVEPDALRQVGAGGEHIVEHASDPSRVLKHSRDGEPDYPSQRRFRIGH